MAERHSETFAAFIGLVVGLAIGSGLWLLAAAEKRNVKPPERQAVCPHCGQPVQVELRKKGDGK
jgi:hypothetical protein